MVRRLTVLLALGVVTTLLVAWAPSVFLMPYGIVAHGSDWEERMWIRDGRNDRWIVRRNTILFSDWVQLYPDRLPQGFERAPMMEGPPPSWAAVPESRASWERVDTGATGWPLRTFASEGWYKGSSNKGGAWKEELRHNLFLADRGANRVFLPLRPIWTGIVGNTLAYAALWGVLLYVPGMIRRAVRRRRGGCPRCGYDVQGNEGACPECGQSVVQTASARLAS